MLLATGPGDGEVPARHRDPDDVHVAVSSKSRVLGAAEVGGGGDFTGGGRPYLLLGASRADPQGRDAAGAVFAVVADRARVDLRSGPFSGFEVAGASAGDGLSAACAADVDGDGIDDVVTGAGGAETANGTDSGAAYVIFGRADEADTDLADFAADAQGDRGFRIDGGAPGDHAGADVGCLDDVNGDGRADVAVGAPRAGATYVVFGKSDSAPVDLSLFDSNLHGAAGFRVTTQAVNQRSSYAVAGVGDTNGDGRSDVVVGVVKRPDEWTGVAYVVFGKTDPAPVDTTGPDAVFEGRGYTIHGQARGWMTGGAVASAGDANGDGLHDVLIGAPARRSPNTAGRAYVVFGAEEADDVFLGDLGDRGFKMVGGPGRDAAGGSVASAGDIDRDGFGDVLVGAPLTDVRAQAGAGAVYVVFGSRRSATVALRRPGSRAYRIVGGAAHQSLGGSVGSFGGTRLLMSSYRTSTTFVVSGRR